MGIGGYKKILKYGEYVKLGKSYRWTNSYSEKYVEHVQMWKRDTWTKKVSLVSTQHARAFNMGSEKL